MSDDYCLTMSTKPELMSRIRKLESELSEVKSILAVRNLELLRNWKERDALAAENAQLKRYLQGEHQ